MGVRLGHRMRLVELSPTTHELNFENATKDKEAFRNSNMCIRAKERCWIPGLPLMHFSVCLGCRVSHHPLAKQS